MKSVKPTTIIIPDRLGALLGLNLIIATETFQHTGSFKFRAAMQVVKSVRRKTIITASSGNFGQALACACQEYKKHCIVVMPATSARIKIAAVKSYGAEVILIDTQTTSRQEEVARQAKKHPGAYIASAYDDQHVIDGNTSLGIELGQLQTPPEVVVCPIGGGGLSSGIIQGLNLTRNKALVIGAEPLLANDAARSFRAGRLKKNKNEPQTIADGARTLSLGKINWEILKNGLSDIIEVPEQAIKQALGMLFHLVNLKVEPTGALSLAAVLAAPEKFTSALTCLVVSGGNVDQQVFIDALTEE